MMKTKCESNTIFLNIFEYFQLLTFAKKDSASRHERVSLLYSKYYTGSLCIVQHYCMTVPHMQLFKVVVKDG